jgi:hypothetical protein
VERRRSLRLLILAVALVSVVAGHGIATSWALFTEQETRANALSAAAIFRDERGGPAFSVDDRSSGSAVDGSSAIAYDGDGRWFLSRTWPTAYDSGRYLELDLNAPLPAALAASSVSLTVRLSADGAGATACYYVELRRASSGALVSSHGSAGSPLACVTGTSFASTNVALAAVTDSDLANDLRIRLYATDSATGGVRIDRLTVGGSTFATFTLYPLLTRDVNGSDSQLIRWGLAGP